MQKAKICPLVLILCYITLFVLIFVLITRPSIDSYIAALKDDGLEDESLEAEATHTSPADDSIALQIKGIAEKFNQEPIDAHIDPVWKAIPGYNGIRINEEKSIRIAQQLGSVQPEHLVIEEVEADISLADLPPNPIYRGNPRKTMASLMINVAWGTEYIESMLQTLAEYEVKATFFLDGKWLQRNKELAQKIVDEGHEIGNHAYSHPDLRKMSLKEISREMEQTEDLIRELGVRSHLFAPPSGAFDDRVVKVAEARKMKTILWTLDTVDWKKPPAETIVERIVPHLENGALILMHPTASTAEALPSLIEGTRKKELLLGTVSELISPARSLSIVRVD